jgi:Putative transposase/Transposase zinc-binding domain
LRAAGPSAARAPSCARPTNGTRLARASPVGAATYQPRDAEGTVLHRVVRENLETFLREAADRTDGSGLPRFIEREFRDFLTCGALGRGFARVRCEDCAFERLVPFSCKRRGFCASCGGRRMAERAAHLVDHVLPQVPVRQWVLSLPHRLRYLLAYNHSLCRAVLAVAVRAVLGFYRRRARRRGVRNGRSGAVTVIQRFGGGLQLNVHFHSLVLDGVFAEGADGTLAFHPAEPPSAAEVARLLATVYRRVRRLLARRGLDVEDAPDVDPLAEESPALAGISSASIQGRIALGARAGGRVLQLGREPGAPWVTSRGPCQAHLEGFDLHAAVTVAAEDRAGVERLCRYVLRPPVAQDRLSLTPDGLVLVTLKSEWHDGTSHLLFTPVEFLEKLAALTPRPRINLVLYHGLLAPRARERARAVAHGATAPSPAAPRFVAPDEPRSNPSARGADVSRTGSGEDPSSTGKSETPEKPRDWKWAELMRRVFDLDVLKCPRCGGRMAVIATIEAADVLTKILGHLGLPTDPPAPLPARPPPAHLDFFSDTPT